MCLDSPNPELLRKMVLLAKRPGILNSISGEGKKAEILFPLMREYGWQAILLTCDDAGIPADAGKKVEIARRLIQQAEQYGIPPERLWIDPLVLAVSAVEDAMLQFIKAVKQIKEEYPSVKITSGLSNVSYGMPARKWINQNFLALALAAGMDSAIMDPTSRDLQGTILAAEVLLGRDHCCRRYNRAYRAGKIGLQRLQRGEKTYEL